MELRRGLWFVGTIGSLAPYIGLLGTVVGIMQAFRAIAESGDAGFEVVSAGISEALIATAVGLLVAILALLLFNWLQTPRQQRSPPGVHALERALRAGAPLRRGERRGAGGEVRDGHASARR